MREGPLVPLTPPLRLGGRSGRVGAALAEEAQRKGLAKL